MRTSIVSPLTYWRCGSGSHFLLANLIIAIAMRCLFSIFAWHAMLALVLGYQAEPPLPQLDVCPVFPVPPPEAPCGPYTYNFCDTPSKTCPFCSGTPSQFGLTVPNTRYPLPPKPYLADVGDYLFYHMLQVEYLVEFSKNPMPYQKKVDLPYCGLDKSKAFTKRGIKFPKVKVGGTLGQVGKTINDGIAAISEERTVLVHSKKAS